MAPNPVQPATPEATALALGLLALPHAALAVTDPADGTPAISRIAFGLSPQGPVTLVSSLAVEQDSFALRLQRAELDYLMSSETAQRLLAENYVGLPF